MKHAALASLAAAYAVLAACGAADERYCKLGIARVAASTEAKVIDGLALAQAPGGAMLAWSDANGTFARRLDALGAPIGGAARVAERCDGGVALGTSSQRAALACLRRATPRDAARPGHAVVYALAFDGERIAGQELASYEPAGSLSDGVVLAWVRAPEDSFDDPVLALAWHDASPDVHRIWFASDVRSKRPAQLVSSPGSLASGPVLAARDDRLALAWSERVARGEQLESNTMLWLGRARADVERDTARVLADGGGGQTPVTSAWIEPWPQLAFVDQGFVVGYRAIGRGGKRPGLQLGHAEIGALGKSDRAPLRISGSRRVGRADGVGRPTLTACMGGIVAATPRSYAGDYFIGINWLSRTLTSPRREQQFYEDARAFTLAAGACLGERALIALAELPQLDRPKAELYVASYACE